MLPGSTYEEIAQLIRTFTNEDHERDHSHRGSSADSPTSARITLDHARSLYEHASMDQLAYLATLARASYHDPCEVTYLKMAIINYTNICVAKCDYCAFYRLPHQKDTYLLSLDQICSQINSHKKLGTTLIAFNGGFHPDLRLKDYAELFAQLHELYPEMTFFEMTVAEFMFSCKRSKLSYHEGATLLKKHGTQWITGGGAEVMSDTFRRRHSPGKYTCLDYYTAQRALIESGLGSTATMVIGFDETLDERLEHLSSLRDFQDSLLASTSLPSFLCWTYKPYNTELGGQEITPEEYWRWMAVCRIYLDNVRHIRTSVLTQNEKALKALDYGANDFDLPLEDMVTELAGATISHDFDQVLGHARHLGYQPRLRSPWPVPQKP